MNRLISDGIAVCFFIMIPLSLGMLSPQRAIAGPVGVIELLHISISLGSASAQEQGLSPQIDNDPLSIIGNLNEDSAFQSVGLPDSLQFAGLAGTLNLAIDNSGKTPLVDGIELAPRETLRFVAGRSGEIRGLQGQVSIRLDF